MALQSVVILNGLRDIYHLLNQTSWNKEYCFSYLGTCFFFTRVFFSLELKNIVLLHSRETKGFHRWGQNSLQNEWFLTNKLDKLGRVF